MNTTTWNTATTRAPTLIGSRAADYLDLAKPRITLMVLMTVAVAAMVAVWGQADPMVVLHALLGTSLVAASSGAGNQWLERQSDRHMHRTARRPLPDVRLTPLQVARFCAVTFIVGTLYLWTAVGRTPALYAVATWVVYVVMYTPLKRVTIWNTLIGAVSGALPVLIGWSAMGQPVSLRAWALFLMVLLWQYPHFMPLAWLYRDEYEAAGIKMVTVVDKSGRRAGVQAVLGALSLMLVSLVPALVSPPSVIYLVVAVGLGTWLLLLSFDFLRKRDDVTAKRLFRASLIYLPSVMLLLALLPLI